MTIIYWDSLNDKVYTEKNLNQAQALALFALEGNQEIDILFYSEED